MRRFLEGALQSKDLPVVGGAYKHFIRIGDSDAVDLLGDVLVRYGDLDMAGDFLNCKNYKLAQDAREWARANGVAVVSRVLFHELDDPSAVEWGFLRK